MYINRISGMLYVYMTFHQRPLVHIYMWHAVRSTRAAYTNPWIFRRIFYIGVAQILMQSDGSDFILECAM